MAGWGLGQGRGPRGGGAAWAPAAAASSAPPAEEVSCCNQSPVCVGLEQELEPEEERLGGEGKEAATGVFPGGDFTAACLPPSTATACFPCFFLQMPGPSLCLHLYSYPPV